MLIKDFRAARSEDVCIIPFESVFLTENIHIKGLERGDTVNTQIKDPVLIVRKIDGESDKYALISGYNGFCIALMNHNRDVNAIIVQDNSRKEFFRRLRNSSELVKVSSLKVPKGWTQPRSEKVEKCIDTYTVTGSFGKKVFVDEQNEILDGYVAVVAAQKLKVEDISVLRMSRKEWAKYHSKKK